MFQSSLDTTKISLTVSSVAKVAIFVVGAYAMAKGFDPTEATNGVQQITDIILSVIPACFAVFHGGEAIWGVVRKFFVVK